MENFAYCGELEKMQEKAASKLILKLSLLAKRELY